jgi:hypothetical protein
MTINLGDKVITKKNHPCGSNEWTVVRTGADIKIKCLKCERIVMIPLAVFNSKIKKIIGSDNV